MASAALPEPLSEQIRQALLEAAAVGYEDAAIRGLCRDGAWEAALCAIRSLDLGRFTGPDGASESGPGPLQPLRVRDAMTFEAATLLPEDELSIADDVMRLGRIRHLPVVDAEGILCGIVSQRDLLRSALRRKAEGVALPTAARFRVSEVMTPDVIAVEADASLAEAASLMFDQKLGCLPVVEGGKLAGILTEADFVRLAFRRATPEERRAPRAPSPSGALPSAAAVTGLEAVALLERAAKRCEREGPRHFRSRARAIAGRAVALHSALGAVVDAPVDGGTLERVLELAMRCAQVATFAAEIHDAEPHTSHRDAAAAVHLGATAAECALDFVETTLVDLEDEERVRSIRRRVWRSRLLVRRARAVLQNRESGSLVATGADGDL